jgi:hypothetical protein
VHRFGCDHIHPVSTRKGLRGDKESNQNS